MIKISKLNLLITITILIALLMFLNTLVLATTATNLEKLAYQEKTEKLLDCRNWY